MKFPLTAIITLLLFLSPAVSGRCQESTATVQDSVTVTASELADRLVEEAMKHIGTRYRYGARGPKSFDCSGFTKYVYGTFGIEIGASSSEQSQQGVAVENSISNLQKGDLLFFSGRRARKKVGHVGIYIEADESGEGLRFIHASTSGGVMISNTKEEYYSKRFLCVRRILPDFVQPNDSPATDSTLRNAKAVKWRDALPIGRKDSRIVMMADGEWSYVSDKGKIIKPEKEESIVLYPDGSWKAVPVSHITIPSLAKQEKAPEIAADADSTDTKIQPEAESDPQYHCVKRGDTLYNIAKKHHTTVKAICELNGIKASAILSIGRKLRVK